MLAQRTLASQPRCRHAAGPAAGGPGGSGENSTRMAPAIHARPLLPVQQRRLRHSVIVPASAASAAAAQLEPTKNRASECLVLGIGTRGAACVESLPKAAAGVSYAVILPKVRTVSCHKCYFQLHQH